MNQKQEGKPNLAIEACLKLILRKSSYFKKGYAKFLCGNLKERRKQTDNKNTP